MPKLGEVYTAPPSQYLSEDEKKALISSRTTFDLLDVEFQDKDNTGAPLKFGPRWEYTIRVCDLVRKFTLGAIDQEGNLYEQRQQFATQVQQVGINDEGLLAEPFTNCILKKQGNYILIDDADNVSEQLTF